jgi:hypothetical protein
MLELTQYVGFSRDRAIQTGGGLQQKAVGGITAEPLQFRVGDSQSVSATCAVQNYQLPQTGIEVQAHFPQLCFVLWGKSVSRRIFDPVNYGQIVYIHVVHVIAH